MGDTIGRYEILRRLGSGGMAEVYLAQLTGGEGFQKRVAIKRVHEDLSLNPEHLRAFSDEARLVAQLSHPNIVQVFEFDHDGEAPFLVMEYVDGLPLSKAVRLGQASGLKLPVEAALAVGVQVCDALAYAHEARSYDGRPLDIVHRDIKPANLMVTPQGQIKVTDFGIARAASNLRQTSTGSGKGTLAYMAPEQLQGGDIGPTADLYALGAVLFELITGRLLFDATSLGEIIQRRKLGLRPEDLRETDSALPECVPVLQRALAAGPPDRFPTAEEMGAALRALPSYQGPRPLQRWAGRLSATEATMDDAGAVRAAAGTIAPEDSRGGPSRTDVMDPDEIAALSVEQEPTRQGPGASLRTGEAFPGEPRDGVRGDGPAPRRRGPIVAAVGVVLVLAAIVLGVTRPWEPPTAGGEAITPVTAAEPTPAESPTEPPTESPTEPPTEPQTESPTEAPAEAPTEAPRESPTEAPTESPTPAQADGAAAAEGSGHLNVRVVPWGTIEVDGVVRTQDGSLENLALPLGEHVIRVVPNDGTPPASRSTTFAEDGEHQKWSFQYVDGAWQVRRR